MLQFSGSCASKTLTRNNTVCLSTPPCANHRSSRRCFTTYSQVSAVLWTGLCTLLRLRLGWHFGISSCSRERLPNKRYVPTGTPSLQWWTKNHSKVPRRTFSPTHYYWLRCNLRHPAQWLLGSHCARFVEVMFQRDARSVTTWPSSLAVPPSIHMGNGALEMYLLVHEHTPIASGLWCTQDRYLISR